MTLEHLRAPRLARPASAQGVMVEPVELDIQILSSSEVKSKAKEL